MLFFGHGNFLTWTPITEYSTTFAKKNEKGIKLTSSKNTLKKISLINIGKFYFIVNMARLDFQDKSQHEAHIHCLLYHTMEFHYWVAKY